MAVYTQLGAETLADIVAAYDVGTLVSAKGIAEGVSNSNWLIETTGAEGAEGFGNGAGGPEWRGARFILTVYEQRTDVPICRFSWGCSIISPRGTARSRARSTIATGPRIARMWGLTAPRRWR